MKEKKDEVKHKSHGGVVGGGCCGSCGPVVLWFCGARSLKGEDRFPAGPRALLRWCQSGRNRLGRMKKV